MHHAKLCILLISILSFLDIGIVQAVSYAYVNSFTGTYLAWTEVGSTPYLGAVDGTNYIATSTANAKEGTFDFPATSGVTALELYAKISNAAGDDYVVVQTELGEESIFPSSTSYQWYSVSKSDNSGFSVTYANGLNTPHRTITIDAARLVYSTGGATYTQYSVGSVYLHGYSTFSLNRLRQSSGTILLNAWSSTFRVLELSSSGTIFLNGFSSLAKTVVFSSVGTVLLEGFSSLSRTLQLSSFGTVLLNAFSSFLRPRTYTETSVGTILLEGFSSVSRIIMQNSQGTVLLQGFSSLTKLLAPHTYTLSSTGIVILQAISAVAGTIISQQSDFLLLILFFLAIFGIVMSLAFARRLEKHDD